MINISNIYKWLELTGNRLNDDLKVKLALKTAKMMVYIINFSYLCH